MKATDYSSAFRRRLPAALNAKSVLVARRERTLAVIGWVGSQFALGAFPDKRRMT